MRLSGALWPGVMILIVPFVSGFSLLEGKNADVERGNAAFKAGKAEEALGHYDKAIAKLPNDAGAHFDRGAALYALSRFDEAAQEFLRATGASDPSLKATAFSNLGNAFFKKDKFQEAIEAYKRALALNPNDKSAKWNLELALQKKKQEEEKKKDDQKQDDNKDQNKDKDEDQKKDQDKDKDQKKDQDQQGKDDQKQEKKPEQEKHPEQQPAAKKDQKQEDAKAIEAVLDSLERSAKDLERERARLRAVRRAPPARDW